MTYKLNSKIIVMFFLAFLSYKNGLSQEIPKDSASQILYSKFNTLANSDIVRKYYTREKLDEIYNSEPAQINNIYKYFFNSYTLKIDNSYNGLRINPSSFDVFEFESFRKKNSRFNSQELVPGYVLELYSDEEIGNIVTQSQKDKAIKKYKKKTEKK